MVLLLVDFPHLNDRLLVHNLADTLKIGRNKAYELVNKGEIKALKVGNQYRIPRDSFISFIKGETQTI